MRQVFPFAQRRFTTLLCASCGLSAGVAQQARAFSMTNSLRAGPPTSPTPTPTATVAGGKEVASSGEKPIKPTELFERYVEIDNANENRIKAMKQFVVTNGLDDDWIGCEKVHGANFGVYLMNGGKTIRYSKRSGIMPDSENFFGYQCLIPELVKHGHAIRKLIAEKYKCDPDLAIVNGELFGGKYDHPLVPKSSQTFQLRGTTRSITPVQRDKFPQYSPDLHFYAFDIKFKATESSPLRTLTFDESSSIFEQVDGLLYARAIIRGPIEKIVAFDVESFTTTIPALVGLAEFPMKNNFAEGLVVRHKLRGDPTFDISGPTILKLKCVAFQEKSDKVKGGRADPMLAIRENAVKSFGPQLPDPAAVFGKKEELELVEDLMSHICTNRLNNVVSKVGTEPFLNGEISQAKLSMMLAQDALKDFLKDADESTVNFPIVKRQEMARFVLFEAKKFVDEKWKDIVDEQKAIEKEATGNV